MSNDPPSPDQTRTLLDKEDSSSAVSRAIVGDDSAPVAMHGIETAPDTVGPYKIRGAIGRGGMGTVYKASHDSDPSRKLVAVKLIRRGMDTDDLLQRFAVERQVLSGLDHPNIARFFEAGETEDGRPYFVMEYVESQPITAYCDANNLSISKRLELFRKVCAAVHHAHTNLVVHRDLKPENIVVTPAGEPKLLDFGIAKLLNPNLAVAAAVTGPAVRLMTPEYASPEQVKGDPISTLSDVYSLGVLLYELLSGHRPYHLATRLEEEIIRVICDSVPDRPSTVVTRAESIRQKDGSSREIDPQTIAERRGGRPDTLRRALSGDLDDIVLQAMSKAPVERYPSAMEMSEDLSRYLRGDPVKARRAKRRALYVARKFVRRHRTVVAATSAATVAVVSFGGIALWKAELEQQARERVLVQSNFGTVLWNNFSNRAIDVNMSPESRKRLWASVLSDFEGLREEHGEEHPVVLENYARALKEMGDSLGGGSVGNVGDPEGALEAFSEAAVIFERLAQSQPHRHDLLNRAAVASLFAGNTLRSMNRSAAAVERYSHAETLLKAVPVGTSLAPNRDATLWEVLANQAIVQGNACSIDEAARALLGLIELRQRRVDQAGDAESVELAERRLSNQYLRLAEIYLVGENFTEAEEAIRQALATRQGILDRRGSDRRRRSDIAQAEVVLGEVLTAQGRHPGALEVLTRSSGTFSDLIAEDPGDAKERAYLCLASIAIAEDRLAAEAMDEAVAAADRALEAVRQLESVAPEAPKIPRFRADALVVLGIALSATDPLTGESRNILDEALRLTEGLAAGNPGSAAHQRRVARVCIALGDLERSRSATGGAESSAPQAEAIAHYRRAASIYDRMDAEGRLCGVPDSVVADLKANLDALTAVGAGGDG